MFSYRMISKRWLLPLEVAVGGKSCLNTQQMKFVYTTMTLFMAMIVKNAHKNNAKKLFKVERETR